MPTEPTLDPIAHNTKTMLAVNLHEKRQVSLHRQFLEYLSEGIGSPAFLGLAIILIGLWIVANRYAERFHCRPFDLPPYPLLQGLIGLGGLLTTIIVLIKQNRLGKMEERRAHLELQVNLLTEQKVTKLIDLMEELRRDLPMIKDRYDAKAAAFQVPTDPEAVLKELDDRQET